MKPSLLWSVLLHNFGEVCLCCPINDIKMTAVIKCKTFSAINNLGFISDAHNIDRFTCSRQPQFSRQGSYISLPLLFSVWMKK